MSRQDIPTEEPAEEDRISKKRLEIFRIHSLLSSRCATRVRGRIK